MFPCKKIRAKSAGRNQFNSSMGISMASVVNSTSMAGLSIAEAGVLHIPFKTICWES